MKILIVSDSWHPQTNGVVRTLEATTERLQRRGHDIKIIGPDATRWCSFPMPTYPEIKLELFASKRLRQIVHDYEPELIHIATEGPLGWSARTLCLREKRPFTTSYHTRFPEYVEARAPKPVKRVLKTFSYAFLRRFHAPSAAVMVATDSIEKDLQKRRFGRIVRWSRGVDTDLFRPYGKDLPAYAELTRPILLYVGRVSVEKNLPAFLTVKTSGSKVVIGEGPGLTAMRAQYPDVLFTGKLEGETLARHYAAADLFVFPSTSDTFGLVLLEACAAGLRVASYPAPGPVDIFADPSTQSFAVLNANLQRSVDQALALRDNPDAPRRFAESFSWERCTEQFFYHLQARTPKAVKRLIRMREWLKNWWKH